MQPSRPWWALLTLEEIGRVQATNPLRFLDEFAVVAMRDPWYAEEFARLGAEIVRNPPHYREEASVPEGKEEAFAKLVLRALLPGETEQRRTAARAVDGAPRRRAKMTGKGTAGAPDTLYDREEIKRAVGLWQGRDSSPQAITPGSIARPGFSRKAVRRVIRLDKLGVFSFGPRGGLRLHRIDGRFGAAPKKVSLRALERARGLKPLR